MNDQQLEELIRRGRELRGVEFKGPGNRNDRRFVATVARAIIALGNLRDGGILILGIEQTQHGLSVRGLNDDDLASWDPDHTADALAVSIDPPAEFEMAAQDHAGVRLVIFEVREFKDLPHLCKRDYEDVLRAGACYVRTRRKPESSEKTR